MSERPEPGARIELEGPMNLRDLGGWPAASGRRVALGRLYRSDQLSGLTDADTARLSDLGIATVVDLRYEAETIEQPTRLWPTVERHLSIPMGGDLADQRSVVERILAGELTEVTEDEVSRSYRDMLVAHADRFARAIDLLVTHGPGLFHCTAGKDRTGLLAMLVLSTVGVDERDVLVDFGLSNRYRAERRIAQLRPTFDANGIDIERFRPALSAPVPAMTAALDWLRAEYGGAEAYLVAAGLDEAGPRLRASLLV